MIRGVHQVLPTLHRGDAMGNYVIALQKLLRSWDFDSKIFAAHVGPEPPPGCHPSTAFDQLVGPEDVVLLHYGVFSWELQPFMRTPARRVLVYHNITPPHFFVNYSLRHYYVTALGRLQLPDAVRVAHQSWTPSLFNKRELDAVGARDSRVVPLLLELHELDAVEPDPDVLARYGDGVTNIIFVGRIAPNKRQEHVIAAYARYRRDYDARARVLLIGSHGGLERYRAELGALVTRLGVEDGVVFTGHITLAQLVAYYRLGTVFLCLSEHEGFAVPLVEAMHFGVPVVALARAAVPGTLGGAGVLLDDLDFDECAAAIHRLCADPAHREAVLAAQRRRLRDFAPPKIAAMVRAYLNELAA